MSRNGSICCCCSPVDFYSRKISRAARSTIAAEARACANGIEVGLWRHSMLVEIFTGIATYLRPEKEILPRCAIRLKPRMLRTIAWAMANLRIPILKHANMWLDLSCLNVLVSLGWSAWIMENECPADWCMQVKVRRRKKGK